jgi:hypothetical protein|tara:strand:+ start:573 stop:851 length:279 start_codon:yes stop_codon:yes gene_type:complete
MTAAESKDEISNNEQSSAAVMAEAGTASSHESTMYTGMLAITGATVSMNYGGNMLCKLSQHIIWYNSRYPEEIIRGNASLTARKGGVSLRRE